MHWYIPKGPFLMIMTMTGEDDLKKWVDENLCIEEFLLAADVDDNSEI